MLEDLIKISVICRPCDVSHSKMSGLWTSLKQFLCAPVIVDEFHLQTIISRVDPIGRGWSCQPLDWSIDKNSKLRLKYITHERK